MGILNDFLSKFVGHVKINVTSENGQALLTRDH